MRGAEEAGATGWMLWNPRNDYTAAALRPKTPSPGEEDRRPAVTRPRVARRRPARSSRSRPWPAAPGTRPANELGRVMILEYHKIDLPEERWTRTPDNFRRDLQRLWERGYRLVGLNDYLDGRIALPEGTTPVDPDLRRLLARPVPLPREERRLVMDPDCAVGHPRGSSSRSTRASAAPRRSSCCPGASPPNRLFNQPELVGQEARLSHEPGLRDRQPHAVARQPGQVRRDHRAQAARSRRRTWVQKHVPGYRFRTLALPMGAYPKELGWADLGRAQRQRLPPRRRS